MIAEFKLNLCLEKKTDTAENAATKMFKHFQKNNFQVINLLYITLIIFPLSVSLPNPSWFTCSRSKTATQKYEPQYVYPNQPLTA